MLRNLNKDNVMEILSQMTIEQKVGMTYCARCIREGDEEFTIELIKKRAVGCIQLNPYQKAVAERVLKEIDYPIILINDAEMGYPTSPLPKIPLVSLSACNKKEYFEAFAKGVVHDAKNEGINGTWGPVVDIQVVDGPCRVHRRFSDNPYEVAKAAEIISEIYKKNHFLSTGKHYPRGDDSPFDTHMTDGISNATEKELVEFDLVPYIELMNKGLLPSIMTNHNVYVNIDPEYPASLSKKVIDIIRNLGFDGITFTDSFAMMGILQKFGEENVYGMAINAGNDIVLPNYRTSVEDAYNLLLQNYKDGAFSEERLNEAARRVLTGMAYVGEKPENPTVFTKEDEKLLHDVSKACITAVCDEGTDAKLSGNDEDRLFIVTTPMENVGGGGGEISVADWYKAEKIAEKIKKEFPKSGVEFIPEYSTQRDNDRVLTAATKYKEVVFVTYCTTTSYLGTDCFTRRLESVINCLIHSGKLSTVVHFGNPYAVNKLLHVKRKIFGYLITESQNYAIDVLKGNIKAEGTLPFNIDFN